MNALDSIPLEQAERQEAEHWWPKPLPRHCQSKFYTARSRTWAGWSSVVFVHDHRRTRPNSTLKMAYTYLP